MLNNIKKTVVTIFLVAIFAIMYSGGTITASAEESGTIGENISWTLSDDGTLTLTGTGEIIFEHNPYYIKPEIPWDASKGNIKKVIIGNGITNVEQYAFDSCTALEEVTIPDSVTVIETNAFSGCENLKNIKIGKNVEVLESFAFSSCYALENIEWGEKLKSIDVFAFANCYELVSVEVPATVTDFADNVFNYCRKLANISIPDSVKEVRQYAVYNTAYYNDDGNWEEDVLYIDNHLVDAKTTISGNYTIRNNP